MAKSTEPQPSYFTSQNIVAPNIDTYYKKVIKSIDAQRSIFNAGSSNIANTIAQKDIDNIFAGNQILSSTPQETRVSAFFRMMGLPVLSGDGSECYSPGFDPIANKDPDRISWKLGIADSCLKQFKGILDDREFYPFNIIKYFQNQDANSSALAIASISPRPFANQLKTGLKPTETDNQFFIISDRDLVLSLFGNTLNEDAESRINSSTHILKPFIVDPRIELTVCPAVNRICVPFLTDKSQTQISQGNYLKRPYIERVIRTRFDSQAILPTNNTENETYVNSIISFAKSNSDITDPTIVNQLSNTLKSLHQSELVNISKLLNAVQAFILEIVQSNIEINKIRTTMNWKPIPNVSGPEYGSVVNPVDSSDNDNNFSIEVQITQLQIKKILNTTDFNIGSEQTDVSNFVFNDMDDMVSDAKHNSDLYDKQLNQLNRRRNEAGGRANSLLRDIEIISGEFSGLGLLDILAVQIALWSISPGSILGLIDKYAFQRMQTINALSSSVSQNDPLSSMTEFEQQISLVYATMQYFYDFTINNDKKSQ